MIRGLVLALTVVTGATGLVYEVAWQRTLATLLGSHAEATAAVLGLFLAGLSAGYALFGALSRRLVARAVHRGEAPPLLRVYGLVEGGMALLEVYASFLERRSYERIARIREISWAGLLLAGFSVFIATSLGRGYSSLAFWMLGGAATSYCFSRMLLSAYERGRMAAGQTQ